MRPLKPAKQIIMEKANDQESLQAEEEPREQESNQDIVEDVNVEVKEHNQQIHTNPTVLSSTFYFISFFLVYIYMSIWFINCSKGTE